MTTTFRPSLWRHGLSWLAAGLLGVAGSALAQGGDWPQHPLTLVMTFPAGSGVDVVARHIQEPLGKQLGQPVVIDYKAGAAGNIASEYVARAKPDGYTLVFGTAATHGSNAALYKKLSFDVENDFVPVAPVLDVSNVLTINPDVINVKTLKEFVDQVKANPGKYNFASTGNGTGTHMAFAEFNSRVGLDMIHVPYKAGKVRLLGVTTAKRVGAVSEVPTIAESGLPGTKGFDSSIWFGIFAPKGMDARIVQRLNSAVQAVLENPEVKAKLESAGNSVRLENPEQFKATVKANRHKWAEVVKAANITLE